MFVYFTSQCARMYNERRCLKCPEAVAAALLKVSHSLSFSYRLNDSVFPENIGEEWWEQRRDEEEEADKVIEVK